MSKTLEQASRDLENADGGPLAEIRRRGIEGIPEDCDACIVSLALQQDTGKPVRICGLAWHPECNGDRWKATADAVNLGEKTLSLIGDFDNGLLPDLVSFDNGPPPDLVAE